MTPATCTSNAVPVPATWRRQQPRVECLLPFVTALQACAGSTEPCLTSAWGVVAVIEYRLLGPIEVDANGQAIEIGGLKQRALLAMLVLRANRPVPRDVLADQLW